MDLKGICGQVRGFSLEAYTCEYEDKDRPPKFPKDVDEPSKGTFRAQIVPLEWEACTVEDKTLDFT